jgi:hypothetical protein
MLQYIAKSSKFAHLREIQDAISQELDENFQPVFFHYHVRE